MNNLKSIIFICIIVFVVGALISILLPIIKWIVIIALALVLASIVYTYIMNIKNKKAIDDNIIEAEVIKETENKE